MTYIVPTPTDLMQISRVADWLELVALVADDGSASASDFEQILRREGTFDAAGRDVAARIEAHVITVFAELESRFRDDKGYYPFRVAGRLLSRVEKRDVRLVPYLFCLCMSYFDHGKNAKANGIDPRLLFEHVSCLALEGYSGGSAKVFGTSRTKGMSAFKQLVKEICVFTGEGRDCRQQNTLNKKDDHIDLVAVKHFHDKKVGKIIFFGQCATGKDWEAKLSELQPVAFWNHWIEPNKVSDILRSFFVPHEVPAERWDYCAQYGGVLFDRRRLSHWATPTPAHSKLLQNAELWIEGCLRRHLTLTPKRVIAA